MDSNNDEWDDVKVGISVREVIDMLEEALEQKIQYHEEKSYEHPDDPGHIYTMDSLKELEGKLHILSEQVGTQEIGISELKKAEMHLAVNDSMAAKIVRSYEKSISPGEKFAHEASKTLATIKNRGDEPKQQEKKAVGLLIETAAFLEALKERT